MEPDVDPVRRESGVHQRPAVELDEVDPVRRALQRTGGLQQGLKILLLVTEVEHQPGGAAVREAFEKFSVTLRGELPHDFRQGNKTDEGVIDSRADPGVKKPVLLVFRSCMSNTARRANSEPFMPDH
jgi:hypothetical protein